MQLDVLLELIDMSLDPVVYFYGAFIFAILSFGLSWVSLISRPKTSSSLATLFCHLFLGFFSLLNLATTKFKLPILGTSESTLEPEQWILLFWLMNTALHALVLHCLCSQPKESYTPSSDCSSLQSKDTSLLDSTLEACDENFDLTPQRIGRHKTPSNAPTYPGEIFNIKG